MVGSLCDYVITQFVHDPIMILGWTRWVWRSARCTRSPTGPVFSSFRSPSWVRSFYKAQIENIFCTMYRWVTRAKFSSWPNVLDIWVLCAIHQLDQHMIGLCWLALGRLSCCPPAPPPEERSHALEQEVVKRWSPSPSPSCFGTIVCYRWS